MAAYSHGIVSSFHYLRTVQFPGRVASVENMSAEENILGFGVGAVVAPIYAAWAITLRWRMDKPPFPWRWG